MAQDLLLGQLVEQGFVGDVSSEVLGHDVERPFDELDIRIVAGDVGVRMTLGIDQRGWSGGNGWAY